jgi:nuclear pore complex protein Nup214
MLFQGIQKLREFRVSADNANSSQLCWNPVINSVLAVCTETGGMCLYMLKEQGIEFHAIDPSLKAKCCCWSPKGKQIVVGFGNGKLMQFNMELKPARTIECPPGLFNGNFDTIAVQWLSTYQFAIALLSHVAESRPGSKVFRFLSIYFYL